MCASDGVDEPLPMRACSCVCSFGSCGHHASLRLKQRHGRMDSRITCDYHLKAWDLGGRMERGALQAADQVAASLTFTGCFCAKGTRIFFLELMSSARYDSQVRRDLV